jgi:pimeloyl-ACP methyl ester carboxylesterase
VNEDLGIGLPDGRQLGISEYGDPRGRPVMFFHGWPSSRIQARPLDGLALARGLRVIAPDRPGVGDSDPRPGRRFGDWPADVAALADALGLGRFLVLAVSGGGPYALAVAARLPERVEAVSVVSGAPPLDQPADRRGLHWAYRTLAGARQLRRAVLPPVLGASRWMVGRGSDQPPLSWLLHTIAPSDREVLRESDGWDTVSASFLNAIRGGPQRVLEEGELYLQPWDFHPEAITMPVSFWHGSDDRNLPLPLVQRLAARIPHAVTHWVAGSGHYALPLRLAPVILDELLAAAG